MAAEKINSQTAETNSSTKKKSPDPKKIVEKVVAKVRNLKKSPGTKKSDESGSSDKKSPAKQVKRGDVSSDSKSSDIEAKDNK